MARRWTLGGYNSPRLLWKNPYPVKKYGREESLRLYREYILASEEHRAPPAARATGQDVGSGANWEALLMCPQLLASSIRKVGKMDRPTRIHSPGLEDGATSALR